jgi:hypothetical protein
MFWPFVAIFKEILNPPPPQKKKINGYLQHRCAIGRVKIQDIKINSGAEIPVHEKITILIFCILAVLFVRLLL